MINTNLNDFKNDKITNSDIEELVQIAHDNGIQADEDTLSAFIAMVHQNGADKESLSVVANEDDILNELDSVLSYRAQEDDLTDEQIEDLVKYVEKNARAELESQENVVLSQDIVREAVISYYEHVNTSESPLYVDIVMKLYDDFIRDQVK